MNFNQIILLFFACVNPKMIKINYQHKKYLFSIFTHKNKFQYRKGKIVKKNYFFVISKEKIQKKIKIV